MEKNSLHNLKGEQRHQLLITCDKKGRPLGTAVREKCHKGDGKTHLAFTAFILDKNGKIILAKRSIKKTLWGGFWDASVVSHVLPGETKEVAAKRRGKEEMGIEVNFKNIGGFNYFAKYGENCENEFCFLLVGNTNEDVTPNPVEISEIRKIEITDLNKEIITRPNNFTPWLKLALEKFDIANLL